MNTTLRSGSNRSYRLGTALIVVLFLLSSVWAQSTDIAKQRLQHLRHGINASEWYAQASEYTPERLHTYTTKDDIALMRKLGFDHVRLSIDPTPMWRHNKADALPADYLKLLDEPVDEILKQGMAVIIDIHPSSEFKRQLVTDDAFVDQFADFWRALARHYADRDPERVFFEVLNEPEFEDGYRWWGVQGRLIAAIRQGAPKNTIIAAGHRWSDINELVFLEPYADRNIIYNFHFYDPHIFTHQGATWGVNYWHYLNGLPYPSTPLNVRPIEEEAQTENSKLEIARYGLNQWNAARMDTEIGLAADWAHRHNVVLTCNEFGVYRDYSKPEARAAWIHDVRTAFEKYGIGWTMWDYQGGFGVVHKENGQAIPDEAIVQALGLKSAP